MTTYVFLLIGDRRMVIYFERKIASDDPIEISRILTDVIYDQLDDYVFREVSRRLIPETDENRNLLLQKITSDRKEFPEGLQFWNDEYTEEYRDVVKPIIRQKIIEHLQDGSLADILNSINFENDFTSFLIDKGNVWDTLRKNPGFMGLTRW